MVAPVIAALALPILTDLAKSGLDLIAGAVKAKGKQVVEEKLGVDIDKELQTEEGRIKLLQLQSDHEQALLGFALKQKELELEQEKMAYADVASARDMNTRINESANAGWLPKNTPSILAFVVVGACLPMLYYTPHSDVRTALVGLITIVLGFYFGSTSSSKTKDDTIGKLLSKDR